MSVLRVFCILTVMFVIINTRLFSQTYPANFNHISAISGNLQTPMRIAVDRQDNIYVSDVNQKSILKYDAEGHFVGNMSHGFSPVSLAVNPEGELFFGDEATGYIYKLSAEGVSEIFYRGTVYPSSIAFSPDNVMYVADNELKKVLVIDVSGNLIQTIGDGKLIFPTGLEYDVYNNRILVAEHGGIGADVQGSGMLGKGPLVTVYMFDRQGNLLGSFGSFGNTSGKFYRVQGMGIGRCGKIYVCEPFQGYINVFNQNGIFITRFGTYGNEAGQLNLPMDIAFDSNDRIIVSCYNKGTLELFAINDSLPSASIMTPDIAVCQGTPVDITIKLTGTAPWNFSYTLNNSPPVTINNIENSVYNLRVTEPGEYRIAGISDATKTSSCFSGIARVSTHPEPTATLNCGNQFICEGSTVILPVHFTGDAPWTFTYTRDGQNAKTIETSNNPFMLEVGDQGLYEITALSGRDCQGSIFNGSAYVTVNPKPVATFISGKSRVSFCENEKVYLPVALTGSAPWSFTYTVDEGHPVEVKTSESLFLLEPPASGSYEIIQVSDDYCTSNKTSGYPDIIILPKPTIGFEQAEMNFCQGSVADVPVHFTGSAPWAFDYTINGGIPIKVNTYQNPYSLQVTEPGTYKVVNFTDGLCTWNQPVTEINIIQKNLPNVTFTQSNFPLCTGQQAPVSMNFSGTAPWTFTYSFNGIQPVTMASLSDSFQLMVDKPGTLELTILKDAGCNALVLPQPVTITEYPVPFADFSYTNSNLQVTFINKSVNAGSYQWNLDDNLFSTEINPVHNYTAYGEYNVTLIAHSNYCGSNTVIKLITLTESDTSGTITGFDKEIMDTRAGELNFNIYPNPTSGIINIEVKGLNPGDIRIEIVNMAGQKILSKKFSSDINIQGKTVYQIDMKTYVNGVYYLLLNCGGITKTQTIVVAPH